VTNFIYKYALNKIKQRLKIEIEREKKTIKYAFNFVVNMYCKRDVRFFLVFLVTFSRKKKNMCAFICMQCVVLQCIHFFILEVLQCFELSLIYFLDKIFILVIVHVNTDVTNVYGFFRKGKHY
jgi:hypothetical protein